MADAKQTPAVAEHKDLSPSVVSCAVLTVSDTRSSDNDPGGDLVAEFLRDAGHIIARRDLVRDDTVAIQEAVLRLTNTESVNAILATGGTGIAMRDSTPDALSSLFDKELPGYGELFRMLSFQQIGPAAMLSRALGGVIGKTIVLLMPGSPAAIRLAIETLILPELPHLVQQAQS